LQEDFRLGRREDVAGSHFGGGFRANPARERPCLRPTPKEKPVGKNTELEKKQTFPGINFARGFPQNTTEAPLLYFRLRMGGGEQVR